MTDYFELLKFPRGPWLDPAEVNARFLQLSAPLHPDRASGTGAVEIASANERFAEMNAAAMCLRDSRSRLQHLLALESGAKPPAAQRAPDGLVDLFTKVGEICRGVDGFLAERARATSPMVQAELFERGLEWTDRVSELQRAVGEIQAEAEGRLKAMQGRWPEEKPLDEIGGLAHVFATAGRWEGQLKERYAALAAG